MISCVLSAAFTPAFPFPPCKPHSFALPTSHLTVLVGALTVADSPHPHCFSLNFIFFCGSPHINSFLPFQVYNPIKMRFGLVLTFPYFLYDWLSALPLS